MSKTSFRVRGVTLIEMMVVVAIVGILVAVAAPSIADMLARRRVEMIAAELATTLAYARSEAGMRPNPVLIYFGGNSTTSCYTVAYWGAAGSCDCTRGAGSACSAPGSTVTEFKTVQVASSTGVAVSSSISRFKFNAPQMTVDQTPSITVRSNRVGALRLDLNIAGRLASCSPDGSITGVVRCAGS